jgi:hypothetical protein
MVPLTKKTESFFGRTWKLTSLDSLRHVVVTFLQYKMEVTSEHGM